MNKERNDSELVDVSYLGFLFHPIFFPKAKKTWFPCKIKPTKKAEQLKVRMGAGGIKGAEK